VPELERLGEGSCRGREAERLIVAEVEVGLR